VAIVERAVRAGVSDVILLDLARVGGGQGSGTETLGETLARQFPEVRFHLGGGIRDRAEAERLTSRGLHGVLVASALHAGTWETRPTTLPIAEPHHDRPSMAE
jgi:phosphoribosylformimino-5-aminoimidazole carboxamide ribotide isomerase